MKPEMQNDNSDLVLMTGDIVSAMASRGNLSASQVPGLITTVHETLLRLRRPPAVAEAASVGHIPLKAAVPIRKSITPDYIICLEDGKKLRMMKRYLRTTYNMTPDEYRARWNLPSDYPMVAPSYAQQRSEFAKKIGLGLQSPRRGRKRAA
jgi:predicted transcriptional regulator